MTRLLTQVTWDEDGERNDGELEFGCAYQDKDGSSVVQSYHKAGMEKLCNPADKIDITIHDYYKRKYKIRTDLTIGMFESDL